MTTFAAPSPPARSHRFIERLVLLHPGEAPAFLWSAAYFFFLLFSYYLLRPVHDTMGIRGDLKDMPWLWTGTTLATLAISPLLGWLMSRFPRRRFMPWLYRSFAIILLVFWALLTFINDGPKNQTAGYAFFIWVSVYNLLSTSLFWAFMADIFSSSQGKRLFGAIGVGGTLGAILGGLIPATLAKVVGPVNLIVLSIVGLEVVARCVTTLSRRSGFEKSPGDPPSLTCPNCGYDVTGLPEESGRRRCPECSANEIPKVGPSATREPGRNVWAGFVLIARSPYLQMMVVYMLLFTITSTFLVFEQYRIVQAQVQGDASRTQLFAWIDLFVNGLTLVTQLFLTGRILTRLGVLAGLLLLPSLTLAGFAALWRWESIAMVMTFQVFRRAMHYAVDRPTREVLYTVLGPDAKYKSKSFIDTFVYRTGDLAGAWASAACNYFSLGMVSVLGLGVAAGWSCSAVFLAILQRRVAQQAQQNEEPTRAAPAALALPVQSPPTAAGR